MTSSLYHVLDRPDILASIFHPRPQTGVSRSDTTIVDQRIPVSDDVSIGGRFHVSDPAHVNLLFFHGNGEIAADYDDLGPIYAGMGINLLAVDYRGYGISSGTPTVSAMMSDCHTILEYVAAWRAKKGLTGPLVAMGRSLGSASALDLAARHGGRIDALIIESGFAHAAPLLRLLGVDTATLGIEAADTFGNLAKISQCHMPTLIIHAEFDHIIPYSDGQDLFRASAAQDKQLLKINNANHNDILMRGFDPYLQAIAKLMERIA